MFKISAAVRFFPAQTGMSEDSLGRRLRRRKIACGVDWDVWGLFGASTETSNNPFAVPTGSTEDLSEASRGQSSLPAVPANGRISLSVDWDVGKTFGASTGTSEDCLRRRLGRRKIAWGVDWDVGKNRKIRIIQARVTFMPAAKDSRPLGLSEVGSYQKPAQKNLTPVYL